jgi:hypothetical protein
MPALPHSRDGKPFDIRFSQVARWLARQPEVRQWIFNQCRYRGLIQFDGDTLTWRGVPMPPANGKRREPWYRAGTGQTVPSMPPSIKTPWRRLPAAGKGN